jgi:hypothetical protein
MTVRLESILNCLVYLLRFLTRWTVVAREWSINLSSCCGARRKFTSPRDVRVLEWHGVWTGWSSGYSDWVAGCRSQASSFRFPTLSGHIFLLSFHVGFGSHPTYCPVGTDGCYPGGRSVGSWHCEKLSPSAAKVKCIWSLRSSFICFYGIDRDNFSFTFRFRWILTYPRNMAVTQTGWSVRSALCCWSETKL